MATERVSLARLWALMATVFVDMMGFLMVMPVLPFYADRLGASPFVIGLMVSAFALAQLLVAPYWGKLSDRRGRRPRPRRCAGDCAAPTIPSRTPG